MTATIASTELLDQSSSDMTETASVDHGSRFTRVTTRRLLAMLLACATLAIGVTAGSGATAEAAPTYVLADVCFQAPVSVGGRVYWGPFNRTVTVDAWLNGQAQAVQTYTPNLNGCIRVPLVTGYHWRFRVYHRETSTWYIGQSGWQFANAGHNLNFGTVWLSAF